LTRSSRGTCGCPLRDESNNYCNTAAGQIIKVCVWGLTKVRVDGNSDNIAVGDALVTHDAKGYAQLAAIDPNSSYDQTNMQGCFDQALGVFATALQASDTDGDIILCFVGGKGTRT